MAGYLQSSGALSFSNISTIADFTSNSTRSLSSLASRRLVGNTTGAVRLGLMYSRGVILNVDLQSPLGSGVYTPIFDFSISMPQFLSLPDGTAFYVNSFVDAPYANVNINPTYTFIKGTSDSFTTGGTPPPGTKHYYMTTYYDKDAQTVYAYGYYSGAPTNQPYGTVYIKTVRLI